MNLRPPLGFEGTTAYAESLPSRLQHLMLPGLQLRYVSGAWGEYITQWLDAGDFVFFIHHVFMFLKEPIFPEAPDRAFVLHHLLEGNAEVVLNGDMGVEVSPKLSHLFLVPGMVKQQANGGAGSYVSVHLDFRPGFMGKKVLHYPFLAGMLHRAESAPSLAFLTSTVVHDHTDNYFWKQLVPGIRSAPSVHEYIDEQAREILRLHLDKIDQPMGDHLAWSDYEDVTEVQWKAVQMVRKLIESNFERHYSLPALADLSGLNEFSLKKTFKRVYGDTIYQYLVRCRMRFAREQVLSTNRTIWDIARSCGYRNQSQFSKRFKRLYKIDPAAMRKQFR